jgi:hypothetical protein
MPDRSTVPNKVFKEALEEFSRSPRFSLFKGVQIARLMPEGCEDIQGIGEMTVEELLALVRERGGLPESIAPEHAEALSHLLVVLGEDSESTPLAPDDDISVVVPDSFSSIDIPTLDEQLAKQNTFGEEEPPEDVPVGSVPLELALRAALSKIVAHAQYQDVRARTLGEFWDPEWIGAPFEEAMTIEQLAGLDLAVLFKKRMVTDTRIQSILRALHRAQAYLEEREQVKVGDTDERPVKDAAAVLREMPETLRQRTVPDTSAPQIAIGVPLPPAALAVVEALRAGASRNSLAAALLERFSLHECVAIVCGDQISTRVLRGLKELIERAVAAQTREITLAFLRAPAVRISHIAQLVSCGDGDISAHSLCIAAAVARGLGAVPIRLGVTTGEEFWTLDPDMVSELLRGAHGAIGRRARNISVTIRDSAHLLDPGLLGQYSEALEKLPSKVRQKCKRMSSRSRRCR